MRLLLFILLSFPVFAQNKDYRYLQAQIDSCVYNGIPNLFIGYGKFNTDLPLIAAKWDSIQGRYVPFTLHIYGGSSMWDVGGISQITYTGKDGFAFGMQLCKGCSIKGINFQGRYQSPKMTDKEFFQSSFETYGDTSCRDAQYSPHAAVVIDPFGPNVPPDGGYPKLRDYYRGKGAGGSTGITIDNCTFNNFTVGLIFSPNGQTANCELMTVSNIRIYNTKSGIVGCQAQEKNNYLSNINCWGRTHTLFVWGPYGNGTPGMYSIDRVQIAGGVVRLVRRMSGGYFPLNISGVNAEMLGSIGEWMSLVGDRLTNSAIGFAGPEITGCFPAYGHIYGQSNNPSGMSIDNSIIRYYGKPYPVLLNGEYVLNNNQFEQAPKKGYRGTGTKIGFSDNLKLTVPQPPGTIVTYHNAGSWIYEGMGMVGPDSINIIYSSPNIKPGKNYGLMK